MNVSTTGTRKGLIKFAQELGLSLDRELYPNEDLYRDELLRLVLCALRRREQEGAEMDCAKLEAARYPKFGSKGNAGS